MEYIWMFILHNVDNYLFRNPHLKADCNFFLGGGGGGQLGYIEHS